MTASWRVGRAGGALRFAGPVGTFTWRMLAVVLVGQGIAISLGSFVARSLAQLDGQASPMRGFWLIIALAVGCLVAAGLMRTRFGVSLGWLMQLLTLASALIVPAMLVLSVFFTGLWVLCLVVGQRTDRQLAARAAGPD